jgi:hypothetical protein
MITEVYEVRDRFAARVAAMSGYAEAEAPFDASQSPATIADRIFAILVASTESNGTRDRSLGVMEVTTRVVVQVQAPIHMTGPDRLTSATAEYKAEPVLIRHLMMQGDQWSYGLRVHYVGTAREFLPGDEWLQTSHTFTIGHQVQL